MYTVNTSTGQLTLGNRGRQFRPIPPQPCRWIQQIHGSWKEFRGLRICLRFMMNSSTGAAVADTTGANRCIAGDNLPVHNSTAGCRFSRRYVRSGCNRFRRHGHYSFQSRTTPIRLERWETYRCKECHRRSAIRRLRSDSRGLYGASPLLHRRDRCHLGVSNTGGLRAFNFSTMKEITGSPYAIGGLAPYSILPFSTGDFVYVVAGRPAAEPNWRHRRVLDYVSATAPSPSLHWEAPSPPASTPRRWWKTTHMRLFSP